jgi:hypothetical protein
MEFTFQQLVLSQNEEKLTDYLDKYASTLEPEQLKRWFYRAARLPGNWSGSHDRNAWLQVFYEKYVPTEVRGELKLTNRRRFQRASKETSTRCFKTVVNQKTPLRIIEQKLF